MDSRYDPEKIEADARKFWDDERCFEVSEDPDKEKFIGDAEARRMMTRPMRSPWTLT